MWNSRTGPEAVSGRGGRSAGVLLTLALALLSLTACAAPTRVSHFGVLPNGAPLVILVLSEDRAAVRGECGAQPDQQAILGCQMSYPIFVEGERQVRAVKIVRYTDALPSELAQEIDAHEFCHAVASLQGIQDPCHNGNGGVVQSAIASTPKLVIERR